MFGWRPWPESRSFRRAWKLLWLSTRKRFRSIFRLHRRNKNRDMSHSRKNGHNRKGVPSGRLTLHVQAVAQEGEVASHSNGTPLYAPVLVLNASYEPINICAARRAIVL